MNERKLNDGEVRVKCGGKEFVVSKEYYENNIKQLELVTDKKPVSSGEKQGKASTKNKMAKETIKNKSSD